MKVVFLSCAKSKQSGPCLAKDMYTSPFFQKMWSYAQQAGSDKVFILSAKYGLLNPLQTISPYDETLTSMGSSARKAWAQAVMHSIKTEADVFSDEFVFLAGRFYREHLELNMKNVSVPMGGLGIGEQLQWLNARLK